MAKKASNKILARVINDPTANSTKQVRSTSSSMGSGTLCSASGSAPAPPTGFQLIGVWAYIVPGQDTPVTQSDIESYGVKISNGPALAWSANQMLQAFLPSTSNPNGWNTLNLLYKYFKMLPPTPGTPQTEAVSFQGQFTQTCPTMVARTVAESAFTSATEDILPTKKSGKTYLYCHIPVQHINGVRLMQDARTPLNAKLIAVAATEVDWTPNPLSHANLHRPTGQLELHREENWWEPQTRFRLMPRNAIVMYQPSSTSHTVCANSTKDPDILEFFNPVLGIYVCVNDFVDPLGMTDHFADNTGYFDLTVKVLKTF